MFSTTTIRRSFAAAVLGVLLTPMLASAISIYQLTADVPPVTGQFPEANTVTGKFVWVTRGVGDMTKLEYDTNAASTFGASVDLADQTAQPCNPADIDDACYREDYWNYLTPNVDLPAGACITWKRGDGTFWIKCADQYGVDREPQRFVFESEIPALTGGDMLKSEYADPGVAGVVEQANRIIGAGAPGQERGVLESHIILLSGTPASHKEITWDDVSDAPQVRAWNGVILPLSIGAHYGQTEFAAHFDEMYCGDLAGDGASVSSCEINDMDSQPVTGITEAEFIIGSTIADNAKYYALSGDLTCTSLGVCAVADDSHLHTGGSVFPFNDLLDQDAGGVWDMGWYSQDYTWDSDDTVAGGHAAVEYNMICDADTTDIETQHFLRMINKGGVGSVCGVEAFVKLDNWDTTNQVDVGVEVTSVGSGVIGTAFLASDPDIIIALALGDNDVTVDSKTLAAAEIGILDGGLDCAGEVANCVANAQTAAEVDSDIATHKALANDHHTLFAPNADPAVNHGDFAADVTAAIKAHQDCDSIYIQDPDATDDDLLSMWSWPVAVTITELNSRCDGGTSVTWDLNNDDGTPAAVNGSVMTCNSTYASDTSFAGDATVAANDFLELVLTTETGTVGNMWVQWCWVED